MSARETSLLLGLICHALVALDQERPRTEAAVEALDDVRRRLEARRDKLRARRAA